MDNRMKTKKQISEMLKTTDIKLAEIPYDLSEEQDIIERELLIQRKYTLEWVLNEKEIILK
ncbi:MAG: hypothetical protein KAJ18_03470 [Candidatus Omnitrophica bacterium]|nr:hypothetical protein [Candidatus Omnitrophota bacterium]